MWNAMINGYFQCGLYETGITLFITMVNWGIRPDGFSLVAVSSCFIDESSLKQGQGIHGFALKTVLNEEKQNQHVISGLVAMYTRCNCLDYGIKMFNQVLHPDLITWSALLCGLFQVGDCENGVKLFRNLIFSGITPDPILISAILSSCAKCAMLRWGKETHGYIFRCNFKDSGEISSALINMYSRCGSIKSAHQIFETVSGGNLVVYNSMIAGLAAHGLGLEAIQLFDELVGRGLRPDGATFAGLLSACRHSGLVDEGQEIFEKMRGIFGILPGVEHYVYMVELLGLAGKLEEAYFLVEERPASGVWGAFLSLCRDHSDVALARVAAERLLELEPRKVAYRVIMSNIYASEGRWEEVRKVREEMAEREMRKTPGCSWILQ
ncbi:putative pentatricopeptide repeat-containing protein At1g64310 [Amborella trichopoda]|uniref:Pentacotripeptide-repeat region of PRORP domain-containing protein n=1 Tax=Amborella trichopoda TaxID=13333 RepID=W1PCS5_AMBTC|nr:putative pentatricopeptide repeat-containing protein At1g64310 [Amborella trichopoda]ERN04845.1 hypothetical protein AMTR_s00146p00058250 [Amborella trichopoda]|eukprot:XP_006843170.1 putative pentatricopeptide repeat-containing protein At1g64310 [Amborella trichopoda]